MKNIMSARWAYGLLFVSIILILLIGRRPAEVISISGKTMGTSYHIKYIDNGHGIQSQNLSIEIEDLLKELNNQMSTYIADSEISQFNKSTDLSWMKISPSFFKVLEFSLEVAKKTKGVFDPTIGPLVNLWGFGPTG